MKTKKVRGREKECRQQEQDAVCCCDVVSYCDCCGCYGVSYYCC
jgi:hypothetical protein